MPLWEGHKNTSVTHMIFRKVRIQLFLKFISRICSSVSPLVFLAPVQYAYFWKSGSNVCKFSRLESRSMKTAQQLLVVELGILHKWESERWFYRHDPTHSYIKIPHLLVYLPGHLTLGCRLLGACIFRFVCLESSEHITGSMENQGRIAIIIILSHLVLKMFSRVELW